MRLLIVSMLLLRAHAHRLGRALHDNDRELPQAGHVGQEPPAGPLTEPAFDLKVQVSDVLSRQPLSQAAVEVYVNHSSLGRALTGQDGAAMLRVPHHSGAPVTVVASKDGYVCSLLPCATSRTPVFSSVTMSLLGLTPGDIWLFEDSVVLSGKTSDSLSPPVVQFPKRLLNLSAGSNVTSVRAFVTVPKLLSEDGGVLRTMGIVSAKSGLASVELRPVAALSVQLFSGDTELQVTGPVQLSLSVPHSCGAHMSTAVPAWFFNRTTGGWMRKGLGKLQSVDGKLLWKFTAPHLGYWIAAPLSSTRGFFGLDFDTDFILQHSPVLMLTLGGALVFTASLLLGLLCYRSRKPVSGTEAKRILSVTRKDQTTSTCDDDVLELQDGFKLPFTLHSAHNGAVIANPNVLDPGAKSEAPEPVPASLAENLFFYNQPVAILHAPAFFHMEAPEEPDQWNRSATLPRAGASNAAAATESKDTIAQAKEASGNQNQEAEDQLGVLEASSNSRGHYSLPESASVPGTLNKIRDKNRHSLGEFSKDLHPARAWFVSLEGKPAAEIHYAVSEQQRRRRAVDSRDTSLDSGVDMSELNVQASERRRPVERNNTFVKRKSHSKDAAPPP